MSTSGKNGQDGSLYFDQMLMVTGGCLSAVTIISAFFISFAALTANGLAWYFSALAALGVALLAEIVLMVVLFASAMIGRHFLMKGVDPEEYDRMLKERYGEVAGSAGEAEKAEEPEAK